MMICAKHRTLKPDGILWRTALPETATCRPYTGLTLGGTRGGALAVFPSCGARLSLHCDSTTNLKMLQETLLTGTLNSQNEGGAFLQTDTVQHKAHPQFAPQHSCNRVHNSAIRNPHFSRHSSTSKQTTVQAITARHSLGLLMPGPAVACSLAW